MTCKLQFSVNKIRWIIECWFGSISCVCS